MPTLHIYTRVSTAAQADEGMSLETQRELGIKRAKELGFEYQVWNEGGRSSNHEGVDKRPVLSQVYAKIKTGEIKHFFVYDQSRLSRNDQVSSLFRVECNRNGVTLYTRDGRYDLSNTTDQFMKKIMDAVAELDNAQRAERTRLGKLARIKQGRWMGGPPPYGYAIENHHLVVNPEEAKWVVRIFEEYADKTATIDIKMMLDTHGVQPRRGGGTWALGSIQALMRNTHYIGFWDYTDKRTVETVRVDCPRLLSSELWSRVEATRKVYAERRSGGNAVRHFYLLRGLLRCCHCGTLLSGLFRPNVGNGLYYCPKKEREWTKRPPEKEDKWKRGRVCKMTRSLNVNETDELVWDTVLEVMSKSHLLKENLKTETFEKFGKAALTEKQVAGHKTRISALKKQVKQNVQALAMLETNRILERIAEEQYPLIRANITAEKVETESEIERLQEEIDGVARNKRWVNWIERFQKRLQEHKLFTPAQRKTFLEGMLTSIEVELVAPNVHKLIINFELPVVEDSIEYIDPKRKTKGYRLREGVQSVTVEGAARQYGKKKRARESTK
jgi:DNA invertase Pin-like site-specific DNA recombinase